MVRSKIRSRLVTYSLALLLAAGSTLTAPSVAHASWYCGDDCNTEDPATYHPPGGHPTCAIDAETHFQTYIGQGLTLELRYSPSCRTIWGRFWGASQYMRSYVVELQRWEGGPEAWWQPIYRNEVFVSSRNWSNMWNDAGVTIRACLSKSWVTEVQMIGCTSGGW